MLYTYISYMCIYEVGCRGKKEFDILYIVQVTLLVVKYALMCPSSLTVLLAWQANALLNLYIFLCLYMGSIHSCTTNFSNFSK